MKVCDVEGALICGGKSSRFGSDKRFFKIEGISLFEIAYQKLASCCSDVVCVFRDAVPEPFQKFHPIFDERDREGPVAGLLAALRHTKKPYLLTLPCDVPYLSLAFLETLLQLRSPSKVVVPFAEKLQPLIAIYPKSFLQTLRDASAKQNFSLTRFIGELSPEQRRVVSEPEWQGLVFSEREFLNLNTPPISE